MADNFWVNQQPWLGPSGGPYGGGGGPTNVGAIQARDPLDAARQGAFGGGRIGEASYPDGYLGPVNNRRQDRLANEVAGRMTDRNYQRGVHAGTKQPALNYYWPAEASPDQGIMRELHGRRRGNVIMVKRHTPAGSPVEHLVNGGKLSQLDQAQQAEVAARYGIQNPAATREGDLVDPARAALLSRDLPRTSW